MADNRERERVLQSAWTTPWLRKNGIHSLRHFVRADGTINLSRPHEDGNFVKNVARAIANWVTHREVRILTTSTLDAQRYVEAAANQFEIPTVFFSAYKGRRGGRPYPSRSLHDGRELFEAGERRIGLVHGELTTGRGLQRFADKFLPASLSALAIVDRGINIDGIETEAQARAYMQEHPDSPPPHIRFEGFVCDYVLGWPSAIRPLQVDEGPEGPAKT